MSVLNAMLQDLERRGQRPAQPVPTWVTAPAQALPGPRSGRSRVRTALLLTASLVTVAAAVVFWPKSGTDLLALFHRAPQAGSAAAPAAASIAKPIVIAAATPVQPPSPAPASAAAANVAPAAPALAQPPMQAAPAALPAPMPAEPAAPTPPVATAPAAPPTPSHPPAQRTRAASAAVAPASDAAPQPAASAAADTPSVAPGATRSEMTRAADLIARGQTTEAARLLASALATRPSWDDARSTLAALQAEGGDRRQALATLLDGVAIDPGRFALTAGQLQAELGDPAGALQTLDRVPAKARDQSFHALAAAVAQRAGRHELAVAEYGTALQFAPADSLAWVGLGVSLQALGRDDQALPAYRAAVRGTLSAELRRFVEARIRVLQASAGSSSTPVAESTAGTAVR